MGGGGGPFPPTPLFFFSVLLIVLLIGEVLKILDLSSPMPASYPKIQRAQNCFDDYEFMADLACFGGVTSQCQHGGDAASKAFEVYSRKTLQSMRKED